MDGVITNHVIALDSTAASIIFTEDTLKKTHALAIQRLIRRLDLRIIPFLCFLEFCSYIHQINIGHAKICGLNKDLSLTRLEQYLSVSLFFIAYFIFEIPSNIILRLVGPATYLSWSMIAWGLITVGMSFVKKGLELVIIRFLLGMAESGFFPGMIIYISLWYRRSEQTLRITIFFLSTAIAGVMGGFLAYGINKFDGKYDLHDWRWMFLLEGIPIIPIGLITCFCLQNIPETVKWLTPCEKQLLTNMLLEDDGIMNIESESEARVSIYQIRHVFLDWKIYLFTLISIGNLGVIRCWTVYFPVFLISIEYSPSEALLLSTAPYVVAFICALIVGFSSSRNNEHGFHLAFSLAISLIGFIFMSFFDQNQQKRVYFSLFIACAGIFTAFPILLSWVTINISGHTKRALAVSFITGFSKLIGILAPFVAFRRGHMICAALTSIAFLVTLLLRFLLNKENTRRKNLTTVQQDYESRRKEPCDWHPNFRYRL